MTIISKFIADDGKEFETEFDCLEYERELENNEFKTTVLLFDVEGKQLPLCTKNIIECVYMVCKTDEAAQHIYHELEDYVTPWDNGKNIRAGAWIFYKEDWINIQEVLNIAEIIKQIIN